MLGSSNSAAHLLLQRAPGARTGLGARQHANLVKAVPLAVQGEQCADLEKAGGDIEGAGDARPLLQVAEASPA